MRERRTKLCLVSSPGGHLYKLVALRAWWSQYERFWVTGERSLWMGLLEDEDNVCQAYFPENRNLINLCRNFWLAWRVLRKERPHWVVSMGAGVAVPFALMAKLMGIKVLFIETFISIPRQTLSGRFLYFFADVFLVQNPQLLRFYPKARFEGSVM